MENVARIETRSDHRKVDLRRHQAVLVEAESASLTALEKCSNASAAFVAFVRDMKLSVMQPSVREMLDRIPVIIKDAASVPQALSDCHALAGAIVENNPQTEVIMSGGIPKKERPEFG